MRDLVLDAPLLQVCLALTLVVAAAALLYRIDRGNRHLHPALRATLGVMRAGLLALLVLLLFRPVLNTTERNTDQPVLLVIQDASQSVSEDAPEWTREFDTWLSELPSEEGQAGADIQTYVFGSDLRKWTTESTFNDPTTDLSMAVDKLAGQWAGRPIGAVILATDGRFNRGRDPELSGLPFGAPVHVIALGDTAFRKDVRIDRVLHNDVAGLGNRFPIEVEIGGQAVEGAFGVTLKGKGGRQRQEVNLQRGGAPVTLTFFVQADTPGIQRFAIEVDAADGEVNLENNRRNLTVEVIERSHKLLITGPAPHPDMGAWTNALSANANYEVVQQALQDLQVQDLSPDGPWDGILFFGFDPGDPQARELFQKARSFRLPVGLVLDPKSEVGALGELAIGTDIQITQTGLTTDPKGTVNPAFPHFEVSEALEGLLVEVPPLVSPFGEVSWGSAHSPLLFQRIGGISTEYPLLTVAQTDLGRLMVLLGEGSWRWRQVGFLRTGSHEVFDEMVGKLIQYLTSDPGVDRFRVEGPRVLDEDERLSFQARVYDATLQPLAGADIALTLTDSMGTSYEHRFSATSSSGYALDAGRLPPGSYAWTASTDIAGETYRRNGTVEIRGIQLEQNGRPAQHDLLNRMAKSTGGTLFSPEELMDLKAALEATDRFLPELSLTQRVQDLIGWRILLWILLGMLTLEWVIRRRAGTY